MGAQPISGTLISQHLYTFVQVKGAAVWAREVHLCLAYWSFVLMSLHAGTHLVVPIGRLRKRSGVAWLLLVVAGLGVSCYGLYQFVTRDIEGYLTLRVAFAFLDYAQPLPLFLLDYLAMMVLFATAGLAAAMGLRHLSRGQGSTSRR